MSTAVIVANGPLRWSETLVGVVRRAGTVLAADGGANHLARIGVRPEVVVGDLDSLRPSVRRWLGEERILERGEQEHTDLHKTLSHAVEERGLSELTVLGALGGRADQALANLGLLAQWSRRCRVELVDEGLRVFAVLDERRFATTIGQTVSLLPLGLPPRVWTEGLHWPLAGEPLDLLGGTGVSNRATGEEALVRVEGGSLLVFLIG